MTKRKKSLKDWDKLDGFQKALEDFNPKESTPANNATPFHSLAAAKPENTVVKNFHGKQAKPETSEKPCKYNVKERRSMERPKK